MEPFSKGNPQNLMLILGNDCCQDSLRFVVKKSSAHKGRNGRRCLKQNFFIWPPIVKTNNIDLT